MTGPERLESDRESKMSSKKPKQIKNAEQVPSTVIGAHESRRCIRCAYLIASSPSPHARRGWNGAAAARMKHETRIYIDRCIYTEPDWLLIRIGAAVPAVPTDQLRPASAIRRRSPANRRKPPQVCFRLHRDAGKKKPGKSPAAESIYFPMDGSTELSGHDRIAHLSSTIFCVARRAKISKKTSGLS